MTYVWGTGAWAPTEVLWLRCAGAVEDRADRPLIHERGDLGLCRASAVSEGRGDVAGGWSLTAASQVQRNPHEGLVHGLPSELEGCSVIRWL